jgi:2-oxo-hept-3-ene-1,7-dioate hydratase
MNLRLLIVLSAVTMACRAAAPSSEMLKTIADRYLAKEPAPVLEKGFSMEEGLRTQAQFVELLEPKLGPVAGYKIGLITKAGQERFGISGPVHGVLLKKMLSYDGAEISANYGVKPGLELDMGVIVKDNGINDAKTLDEAIAHLSYLCTFIELVDTITATNQPMDAPLLVALNVGARGGVIGSRVKMSPAVAKALPEMRMFLTDETGKVVADVPKLNLQPLDNMPWLIAELKKNGTPLKAGDFISVGSPAAIQPVTAGKKITLHYEIKDVKPLTVSVKFKE